MIAGCIAKTIVATCFGVALWLAAFIGLAATGIPIIILAPAFWIAQGFIGYQSERLWNSRKPERWAVAGVMLGPIAFPAFWYCKESYEAANRKVKVARGPQLRREAPEGNEEGGEAMVVRINLTVLALVVGLAALLASGAVGGFLVWDHFKSASASPAAEQQVSQATDEASGHLLDTTFKGTALEEYWYDVLKNICVDNSDPSLDPGRVDKFCDCQVHRVVDALGGWEQTIRIAETSNEGGSTPQAVTDAVAKASADCQSNLY